MLIQSLLSFTLISTFLITQADSRATSSAPDCPCSKGLGPICGVDGVTYPTECHATQCGGTQIKHYGACKAGASTPTPRDQGRAQRSPKVPVRADPQCELSFEERPVCGKDGVTYSNESAAKCIGHTEVVHSGECEACSCPEEDKPVCDSRGNTYPSACIAKCYNVWSFKQGPCKQNL